MKRRCPHDDVRFCPLYIAAHAGNAPSCDDGGMWDGGCAVDRGMSYARQVELLRVKCPGMVEQAAWSEDIDKRGAQRLRNLRQNGIH